MYELRDESSSVLVREKVTRQREQWLTAGIAAEGNSCGVKPTLEDTARFLVDLRGGAGVSVDPSGGLKPSGSHPQSLSRIAGTRVSQLDAGVQRP
jgi:hypothetical protein